MSGSINFSGLSSGIDSASIISQLISVERQPEDSIKLQQGYLQQRQTAYNAVSAKLIGLQATTYSLDALRAFNLVTATSSSEATATVSAVTGAQTGTHTITVTNLAQAQLISTGVQTSQTNPLNQHGQIIINGKTVTYQDSDSLQTLAANINAAQAGVSASIITPTAGQYYLTLGSTTTGLANKINLSDAGSGTLLSGTLGLFGATSSFAHALTGGVYGSGLFADSATSVGTLEGQTAPAAGNVQLTIGGVSQNVTIDLSHSLSQIASDINGVVAGTAQVVTVVDPLTNTNKQQLQLNNVTAFTDSNNVLGNLGIVQKNLASGNELTPAKDAAFTIDNLTASRATNSFTDAISGVTINLVAPGTTSLTVASDTTTIKSNIQAFVTAYNAALDTIDGFSQYDPSTGKTGPLFGDGTTQGVYDSLVSLSNNPVSGLPLSLSLLSQIGITSGVDNRLTIDDSKLTTQLTTNLSSVAKLFQSFGAPTNANVQYVSGSKDTSPSPSSGYAVQVFTPASQGIYTSASAQTQPLATDETLTFAGAQFGSSATGSPLTGVNIQLHAGASAADIVSQINADPVIGSQIIATLAPGGQLRFTSKNYGSAAEFGVVSSSSIGIDTSGIGTTPQHFQGVDVVGTINGETATGVGQYLTGSQIAGNFGANGQALGLQLRVTATAAGSYGNVVYTTGVANVVKNYITSQTDQYTGALTQAANGLQTQIDDYTANINDLEDRLKDEQQRLKDQFTAMEVSIAQIKAAGAGIASLATSSLLSNSNSSSN